MGNNPGKQRNETNFEREGYQSTPRSNSIKLMDDDQIKGYRTPKTVKRNQSANGDKFEQIVGKPDFVYNDASDKKKSKKRGRKFFCGTRD